MSLPEIQQAQHIIDRSSSILLITPPKPSHDAFSSMIALYLALLEHHKGTVDAVNSTHVPQMLQFLPGSSQVRERPQVQPDVVLDIAGPESIQEIRHETLSGGLRIHVTLPENTQVEKTNLETHVRQLPYDAVVVFGADDLEDLGNLFTNYADFFYNTPVINIDHAATNEHFGTVNLIDITACSIAEVTYELISSLHDVTMEGNLATALYAGIVAATNSFQKPSTTPRAFQLAANLMTSGADKELVIQNLVKTKPLHLLKLTGRAYARLRHDEHRKLFWSVLTPIDFRESGGGQENIKDVMDELTNNISGYNAAFVIYENGEQQFSTYMRLGKGLSKRREDIQAHVRARRENGALTFTTTAPSLEAAERQILETIGAVVP